MSLKNKLLYIKNIMDMPREFVKGGLDNAIHYYKNSSASLNNSDVQLVCRDLRILTHVVEKGLSLPNVKKGFGKEKIKEMLELLDKYIDIDCMEYDYAAFAGAIGALELYIEHAEENECDISYIDMKKYQRYYEGKDKGGIAYIDYESIQNIDKLSFEQYAYARHSIRGFGENAIETEQVKKAIKLAQTAPSACNRQSIRVIHVKDKNLCKEILGIQGGAKGHSITEVLLVVGDLRLYKFFSEMDTVYLDGGIFTMNLLYALTYYKIATCPLIWNDYGRQGKEIREIIDIPQSLQIIDVIQIGSYPQDNCKYAISKRMDTEKVYINGDKLKKYITN